MEETPKGNKTPVSTSASTLGELTTKALDFLSTASSETLGACAIGIGAATYLVLGRVGLLLIGAVAGIVLHASWEGSSNDKSIPGQDSKRRKESGLEIVKRLLDQQYQQHDRGNDLGEKNDGEAKPLARQEPTFEEFKPETAVALSGIVDAIVKDYVKFVEAPAFAIFSTNYGDYRWWYSPLLPADTLFPNACRRTLTGFICSMSSHLSRKRPADLFLNFLTNSTSIFIVFLSELSNALMVTSSSDTDDAIQHYLEQHPESSLANVLDKKEQEKRMRAVSEDLIQKFLDTKSTECEPVREFLVQTLSGLILESVLKTSSKPEWINGWIVYLLEQGEPEIMNAINTGVGDATAKEITTVSSQSEAPPTEIRSADGESMTKIAYVEAKRPSEIIATNNVSKKVSIDEGFPSAQSAETLLTPTSSPDLAATHNEYIDESTLLATSTNGASAASQSVTDNPQFTNFDQLVAPSRMSIDLPKYHLHTLHNAKVSIFDDAQPGDKSVLRSKPAVDYLIQIEPASSQQPGWMIARRYGDFETLHEVLRRISVISGVAEFNHKFAAVPPWRSQTKTALRTSLELYLQEALSHIRLAESEGMKRFLEKDQGLEKLSNSKSILGFPSPETFQSMGKGMLDVLASAPKGAAGGGKAFFEGFRGVSGVFGGPRKSNTIIESRDIGRVPSENTTSWASANEKFSTSRPISLVDKNELFRGSSLESLKQPARVSEELAESLPPSQTSSDASERRYTFENLTRTETQSFEQIPQVLTETVTENDYSIAENDAYERPISLPPRPSELNGEDDYMFALNQSSFDQPSRAHSIPAKHLTPTTVIDKSNDQPLMAQPSESTTLKAMKSNFSSLTTEETQVAVELIFAVINELYTLSSAWNIRKTLLNAAKAFLLRPGNPSLEQIRSLLQEQVVDANTTDIGVAAQLRKLRQNGLPTEDELAQWPSSPSLEERENLRIKSRKLLIEQGIPPALRSIMGAAASGEALSRLFDALQVERVSRALMFALLLQGLRAVTH